MLSFAEDILEDGVGLLLESSGDCLDEDSELFSEFEVPRKVRSLASKMTNNKYLLLCLFLSGLVQIKICFNK